MSGSADGEGLRKRLSALTFMEFMLLQRGD